MSQLFGQSGSGGLGVSLLQQSDDRLMPKWHQWDYAGTRNQLDPWADGMLWPRSRFAGADGNTNTVLAGGDTLGSTRFESDIIDVIGGQQQKKIIGNTLDSTGAVLGNCIVKGFVTSTNVCVGQVTSDPGGYYELPTQYSGVAHYCLAYKSGAPDVTGATVNTLIPA